MIKFRILFEDMCWANNDEGTVVGSSGVGAMMGSSDKETIHVNGKQRRGSNVWEHASKSIGEQWY